MYSFMRREPPLSDRLAKPNPNSCCAVAQAFLPVCFLPATTQARMPVLQNAMPVLLNLRFFARGDDFLMPPPCRIGLRACPRAVGALRVLDRPGGLSYRAQNRQAYRFAAKPRCATRLKRRDRVQDGARRLGDGSGRGGDQKLPSLPA